MRGRRSGGGLGYVSRAEVIRREQQSLREFGELRNTLRRHCLATERYLCAASDTVPELDAAEFDNARQAAHNLLGLTFCVHCGRPCDAESDLCDRPGCLASVPELEEDQPADRPCEQCGEPMNGKHKVSCIWWDPSMGGVPEVVCDAAPAPPSAPAPAPAQQPVAAERLIAAIRAFTVDVAGGALPNGDTERAIAKLGDAVARSNTSRPKQAFAEMCECLADDTQRLREAAEAYFGGDFRAEAAVGALILPSGDVLITNPRDVALFMDDPSPAPAGPALTAVPEPVEPRAACTCHYELAQTVERMPDPGCPVHGEPPR